MKFKVVKSFFNFDKNGNPKPVKVGTELPARVYNNLTPEKQAKCEPVVQVRGPKQPWTEQEFQWLVTLYLNNLRPDGTADHGEIATMHLAKFPLRAHSGAWMAVDQIRAHDSFVPQTGLESARLLCSRSWLRLTLCVLTVPLRVCSAKFADCGGGQGCRQNVNVTDCDNPLTSPRFCAILKSYHRKRTNEKHTL